jgi:hypothetical protein
MKLNEKSRKSIFVGDPEGVKGFTFYDPLCREFVRSRDVRFREKEFHDFDDRSTNSDAIVFPIMIEEVPEARNQEPDDERDAENVDDNNQRVGGTFEERFMNDVRTLANKGSEDHQIDSTKNVVSQVTLLKITLTNRE